jgi:hypothetical protein
MISVVNEIAFDAVHSLAIASEFYHARCHANQSGAPTAPRTRPAIAYRTKSSALGSQIPTSSIRPLPFDNVKRAHVTTSKANI